MTDTKTFYIFLLFILTAINSAIAEPKHALALQSTPKYAADFKHFDYVNPKAPKGGEVKRAATGTFDSLNPFILKGIAAAGTAYVFETLGEGSLDEPFTQYGLLAQSMDVAKDNTSVTFSIWKSAKFSDGTKVTAEDVVHTFDLLIKHGHPHYRAYYKDIVSAKALDKQRVIFKFKDGNNQELPMITSQLPVLSKAFWQKNDFKKSGLTPIIGSGPYLIDKVDSGRSISYKLNPNYWGKDLAINRGRHNFARIHFDYYRDRSVELEAFKAGEYDLRQETMSKAWATGYNGPGLEKGLYILEEIQHELPTGMQGYWFNTRKAIFADVKVRQALGLLFDFEWSNKNLFYGAYARTTSYFSNSELASKDLPSKQELAILETYRKQLPKEVFSQEFKPTVSDGSGNIRKQIRKALTLLKQAGWSIDKKSKRLTKNGKPFEFELMLYDDAFERISLPFKQNLERVGITLNLRIVDVAQYQKRTDDYDFDMIVASVGQSLSPGNEQRDYWTTEAAAIPGGRNKAGIANPVIDELVKQLINAKDRNTLIHQTRALDRVLLWGHYIIPHWHSRSFRLAYWDKFSRPTTAAKYGVGLDTWWVDANKLEQLKKNRQ